MSLDQTVVEKIRKLLALADGNQNEHEREVAMRFAMDLLAKHNLTLSEVHGALADKQVQEVDGDFRLEKWIQEVLSAVCTLYYTDYYVSSRWNTSRFTFRDVPVFVGTADNIAVTIAVATWLIESIRRESNQLYKSAYERRSFRVGAADRLFDRATEMIRAETSAAQNKAGTSLVVIRNQLQRANQEHLAKLNLHYIRRRRTYVHPSAYSDGEAYGDQVNLSRQEQSAKAPARIPVFNSR